ncbi:MAG TPA: glycosyltransferase, partial [Desulfomonilia bacterium]|nr:glycosyltransferase [Desulfomonilia bacterium]
MKIILFYSSIGQGHISAARAIEQEIRKEDPSALVAMKDIRDFMDPMKRMLDEKIYWFVAKNLPDLFNNIFISMQEQGNKTGSLAWLQNDYPEMKVLEYIKAETPDAILATHYGSAQVLGTLREKGLIPGIKLGWLHTDYFEGYFPRISKRIDRTFLAHPELKNRWLAAGVPPELIDISGMPVNIPAEVSNASNDCLTQIGFDPKVKTITIAGGKEGAADFSGVVMSIAHTIVEPLQIIAVCGRNEPQQRVLEKIHKNIPHRLKLKALGFIPQTDLVSFICASDVFITKAGGLSPAEAFTIGKPTILLNEISGHERENAELFSKLGMAEFNTDVTMVGTQVQAILSDQGKQASMLAAQKAYRDNVDIRKIACFLLDTQEKARCAHSGFGLEKGIAVNNVHQALARLETDAPSDIEILLSYSSSIEDERVVMENPFGHIAIRIGDIVYSANHLSNPEKNTPLLQRMSLDQYLFGILPPSGDQIHTSTYGMSYGRDTLGFRVKGLAPESLKRMHEEATKIQGEFCSGKCKWNRYSSNCADFVARILYSGFDIENAKSPSRIIAMPLDVFEKSLAIFEGDPNFQTELVAYRRMPGSQASYRFSRFPLSLWQPVRALVQVLKDPAPDKIEQKVSRQLTGYMGDDQIYYEDLCARLSTSAVDGLDREQGRLKGMEQILLEEVLELIVKGPSQTIAAYKEKTWQYFMQELSSIMERYFSTASISAEYADDNINSKNTNKLREAFTNLKAEYAILHLTKGNEDRPAVFIERLSEFYQAIERV